MWKGVDAEREGIQKPENFLNAQSTMCNDSFFFQVGNSPKPARVSDAGRALEKYIRVLRVAAAQA
jgi:hypothetical protein